MSNLTPREIKEAIANGEREALESMLRPMTGDEAEEAGRREYFRVTNQKDPKEKK